MASMIPYDRYSRALRSWPFDDLDRFFDAPFAALSTGNAGFKMNVEDAGTAYVVTAELPGVTRDQIDVELNEGRLSIAVEKKESDELPLQGVRRVERHPRRLPQGRGHDRPHRQARGRHPHGERPQAGREGQRHQDRHRLVIASSDGSRAGTHGFRPVFCATAPRFFSPPPEVMRTVEVLIVAGRRAGREEPLLAACAQPPRLRITYVAAPQNRGFARHVFDEDDSERNRPLLGQSFMFLPAKRGFSRHAAL